MRAMWTGTIAFGLVSIPVNVYTATDRESGPELHYVHAGCGGRPETEGARVSARYRCSHCEQHLSQGELNKGYMYGEELLTFTADELDELNGGKVRTAEVLEFVDAEEIPVELYGSLYYVAPIPPRAKSRTSRLPDPVTRSYQLLVETLRRTGRVGLVSIQLRNREHRAVLAVSGDILTLRVLLWTAQVRDRAFDGWDKFGGMWPAEELTAGELAMAASTVEAMSGKFDVDAHVDPYAVKLTELIEAKAAALFPVEPVPDNVIDLLAVINRTVSSAS